MHPATLADRLRGIVRPPANVTPVPALTSPRSVGPAEANPRLEAVLGGQWTTFDQGRCFMVDTGFSPDHAYGCGSIGGFAARIEASGSEAALLGVSTPLPFTFFDLETTGLSGGAGSCAFLVGCGRFDAHGAFMVRQFLLTGGGEERCLLEQVRLELSGPGTLVSFNGKSFDAPVLETRYALHRLPSTEMGPGSHLDVLHPARRFWAAPAESGGSCSLSALEQQVLGVRRVGDVAGADIPWRYFQFIRSGDPRPLAAVLEHNRLDLVSLAGLTARLLELLSLGAARTASGQELLALGRIYARAGREALAADVLQKAAEMGAGTPVAMEARRWLAIQARRARRHDEAARHWQTILNTPGCPPRLICQASEALAVHHEHRARDLEQAQAYAVRSLQAGERATLRDAARYRLARLARKMAGAPLLE